jgi:hypothetical protein
MFRPQAGTAKDWTNHQILHTRQVGQTKQKKTVLRRAAMMLSAPCISTAHLGQNAWASIQISHQMLVLALLVNSLAVALIPALAGSETASGG